MYKRQDLDTFEGFPWRPQQGKVARFICDVYNPDGTPFSGCLLYTSCRSGIAEEMLLNSYESASCVFIVRSVSRNPLKHATLSLIHISV